MNLKLPSYYFMASKIAPFYNHLKLFTMCSHENYFLPSIFCLITHGENKIEGNSQIRYFNCLKNNGKMPSGIIRPKVNVAIVIVGIDGRILASSRVKKWIQDSMILPNSKLKPLVLRSH